MKPLLITQVLGRPKTTIRCFGALLENTYRDEFEWVIVDQDANKEVKEVISRFHPDYILRRAFNSGIVFGINEAMAKYRKSGQSIIKLDDDVVIGSFDWLWLFKIVLQEPSIGSVLGRRPTFFIDEPSRFEVYKTMPKKQINEIWVEMATIGLVGCWWMIKGEVLDKLGYLNEDSQNDDWDYWHRMKMNNWESCYIPDAVCRQPFEEPVNHPTYGIHKKIVAQQTFRQNLYNEVYQKTNDYYLGSRFDREVKSNIVYECVERIYNQYREENENKSRIGQSQTFGIC